jgi:hypothetical protein
MLLLLLFLCRAKWDGGGIHYTGEIYKDETVAIIPGNDIEIAGRGDARV